METINILNNANFWDGRFKNIGIDRNFYMSKITSSIGNQLIKVLVGQRRTGKSFLLRQIMRVLTENFNVAPQNILYINKENLEFDFVRHYSDLDQLIKIYINNIKPKGKIYLFFDEVQQIDGWENLVTAYAQSYKKEFEIFITGSNSDLLSSELATRLTGRYIQFHIYPFSYEENIQIKNLEKGKASYLQYLKSSGIPELYSLPNDETRRHYISALTDTIVLRDIVERYNVRDVTMLKNIFAYLVNNTANLTSINNVVNYLKNQYGKAKYETVDAYIKHFSNAYMIHEVPRFKLKGKAVMSGVKKFYLNDLGYKNFLYSGFEHGFGYLLENLVYLQLKRKGFEVYVGSLQQKEIDFVAIKKDQPIYIQVSYSIEDTEAKTREYAGLLNIKDNYPKIVITLDDIAHPDYNGVKNILAWELEEKLDGIEVQ